MISTCLPKQKTSLKSLRFLDIVNIQDHAMTLLKSISEERFQHCFVQWKHTISACIAVQDVESDRNCQFVSNCSFFRCIPGTTSCILHVRYSFACHFQHILQALYYTFLSLLNMVCYAVCHLFMTNILSCVSDLRWLEWLFCWARLCKLK